MSWMSIATEILAYLLTGVFVARAYRKNRLPILITACLFGIIVEYLTVRTRTDYCYGQFMLMFPPMSWPVPPDWCAVGARVPVWGSLTWGMLIYGAMTLSSAMAGPLVARCMFDALLVLTIDWILDPLASWVSFWTWQTPGPWFGIPLDNFAGWFLLVFSFSFMNRLMRIVVPRYLSGAKATIAIGATTIVFAFVMLKATLTGYVWLVDHGVVEGFLLAGILAVSYAVAVPYAYGHPGDAPAHWHIFVAALITHAFYVTLIVASGLAARRPALLVVAAVTFVITVVGYSWPFRKHVLAILRSRRLPSHVQPS